jgi:hypothetical protein
MPSRFRLAVPPAANPMIIPSEFTVATPAAPGFHSALDMDRYRTHPIFEFHFVENVTQ